MDQMQPPRRVTQIGLVCRGERQTLQGKSPKLSRISYTISGKLDERPTDLDSKLLGSFRIKKRLMRSFRRNPGLARIRSSCRRAAAGSVGAMGTI